MATVFQSHQFSRKALIVTSQNPHPISKSSLSPQSLSTRPSNGGSIGRRWMNLSMSSMMRKPSFKVLAVPDDDEWGPEPASSLTAQAVAEPPMTSDIDQLKKQLIDSFYGTNRGLSASAETRAEIVELITQLEAKNPTPAPTEALSLLDGKWILAYTSFSGLFPLLSRGTNLLVKVEEISQTIDSGNLTVQNSVRFSGPLASTSISTNADFEVRSPKRVQIKFIEGIIGTPQLTDSIVFPDDVEIFGQKIDLSPLKGLFTSVQDTASSVAKTISNQPPLKFNFSNRAESWLLTTYLDEELRISRADGGSVFVLLKEKVDPSLVSN